MSTVASLRERTPALGGRVVVALTLAVAVLSLVTGIANIGVEVVTGPLAQFVPPVVQQTAGFTGALTGFLMLASALGLRRGYRAAWLSTVVLLPMTAVQGVAQSSPLSVPLVVLSAVTFPAVVLTRSRFDRDLSFSTTQLAALAAIVGAQVYGTVGTYALRAEFVNVESLVDAFYYTLVTASTVGYGDTVPRPASEVGKLFSMSVLLVGTASFAIALTTLLGPAIESRFRRALGRMTDTQLELLEGHILILGYGDLTEAILDELADGHTTFLVLTTDQSHAAVVREREYDVLVADPSDEEPLQRANIDAARAVIVATNNDAEDALAVLTARQLNPDIPIVAAATNRENVDKLRRAGADTVISPASLGGRLLVQSALGREGMEALADRVLDEAADAAATDATDSGNASGPSPSDGTDRP